MEIPHFQPVISQEETGYLVEPDSLTGVYMNLNVVALVFRCRIVGGTASTSDETSRLR